MHKSLIALALLLAVFLCGCAKDAPVPTVGDFDFTLPDGYFIGDAEDTSCLIFGEDGVAVGGINLTDITPRNLADSKGSAMPEYLEKCQSGSEFFSWVGGDKDAPIRYVSQQFADPQTGERRYFTRVLFVKEGGVYDMWFDNSLIEEEEISAFYPIAEGE